MKKRGLLAILSLLALVVILAAFWIGGTIMDGIHTDNAVVGAPVRYLIILGSGLDGSEPGSYLSTRIDTAVQFLEKNPDVIAICSGAQCYGDDIPEAESIAAALEKQGISKARILLEDQSRSTYENLKYCKQILNEHAKGDPYRAAIVTSDFHIYRSRQVANLFSYADPMMLPATTPTILLYPALLREIAATAFYELRYY